MKNTISFWGLAFIAVLIVSSNSCKKDDDDSISLSVSEKILNFGDKYQIEASSSSKITYSVENEYNAEVSETGVVTAKYIGETNIILENAEDKKTLKIIVEPKYNVYPEPDIEFGDTKNSIIAQFGNDYIESESTIGYFDYSSNAPMIIFTFDESNILDGYTVLINSTYSSMLDDFLAERYFHLGVYEDLDLYLNKTSVTSASMAIGIGIYDASYWMVTYVPYSYTEKSAKIGNTSEYDDIHFLLKSMIKRTSIIDKM